MSNQSKIDAKQDFRLVGGGYKEGGIIRRPITKNYVLFKEGGTVHSESNFHNDYEYAPALRGLSDNVYGTSNRIPNIKEHITQAELSRLGNTSNKLNEQVDKRSNKNSSKVIKTTTDSRVMGILDPFPLKSALNKVMLKDIFGKADFKKAVFNKIEDTVLYGQQLKSAT